MNRTKTETGTPGVNINPNNKIKNENASETGMDAAKARCLFKGVTSRS